MAAAQMAAGFRGGAMKQTLEQKQAMQARLAKAYTAKQRQKWQELIEKEPRILALRTAIGRTRTPQELLAGIADCWVRFADLEARYAALRLIDKHCNKMARFAGRAVLDDPLPPATNCYLTAREMLAVR